ncbi:MAG: tRNA (adenosine(37)-N6)-threonylcarbamoyltransferase complex transferase subunit TsaD [Bacteroidales bacterium]|nr:tRNA (adenosine(37)-N6)-threonylcarbamoyltransferase complex transferase subunit TsaD [Bacteroidales bacterium]MBQ5891682.1 tRNA (adenosine(37)-N6)-threonylcarbamoyltransferase complex transferase subunit TsaD [Bacteroidales bacterium]MEE1323939.1 tRNA (adenosine(37)-N6)-threonylcarbamoyltransferase complex transferase subunit TsaD [Bacteroidales bacterium]
MMKYILAIESSCDDTSCAIIDSNFCVLSNVIASQEVHKSYGGVVPELASRAHQQNIIPVVDKALKDAKISKKELSAVAFTRGPGLMGSLLVGVSFAKSFARALNIPLIDVNHLEAHVLAHFIKDMPEQKVPQFPFLCLLVSGGNTQIILLESPRKMKVIGQTIDDAAGETIDKAAKILSLPYPGGPHIDRLAKEGKPVLAFSQSNIKDYDYSFSGLKTSILYTLRDKLKENPNYIEENLKDIACSVQKAVVDSLLKKFEKAIKDLKIKTIAVAGGVSANSELRARLQQLGDKYGCEVFIPKFSYTTDNAAMVAVAGLFKYMDNDFADLSLTAYAR